MAALRRILVLLVLAVLLAVPAEAWARRSGGSFSGRGFRSLPSRTMPRHAQAPRGGTNFILFPGFGWGLGGLGFGGAGSLLFLGVLGAGALLLMRSAHRQRARGDVDGYHDHAFDDRAYLHRLQIAFGRSGRSIQDQLARFAEEGDTGTELGLARLLQQTAVEMLREKDAIRYVHGDATGPLTFVQAETKMNGMALKERSQFQVERVRGAGGKVHRSTAPAQEGAEVLEYVVVTLLVATRTPLECPTKIGHRDQIDDVLATLGAVAPQNLLGLEVIWTPADPEDTLTTTDLLTSYPDLQGV